MAEHEDWVAANGPRLVRDDPSETVIPDGILDAQDLSLAAKGLYALALFHQGQPFNPYEDAFEDAATIRTAVDELISAGLISHVSKP